MEKLSPKERSLRQIKEDISKWYKYGRNTSGYLYKQYRNNLISSAHELANIVESQENKVCLTSPNMPIEVFSLSKVPYGGYFADYEPIETGQPVMLSGVRNFDGGTPYFKISNSLYLNPEVLSEVLANGAVLKLETNS